MLNWLTGKLKKSLNLSKTLDFVSSLTTTMQLARHASLMSALVARFSVKQAKREEINRSTQALVRHSTCSQTIKINVCVAFDIDFVCGSHSNRKPNLLKLCQEKCALVPLGKR